MEWDTGKFCLPKPVPASGEITGWYNWEGMLAASGMHLALMMHVNDSQETTHFLSLQHIRETPNHSTVNRHSEKNTGAYLTLLAFLNMNQH